MLRALALDAAWRWRAGFTVALVEHRTGAWRLVEIPNRQTDAGLSWIRDRARGASTAVYTEMAVGTGSGNHDPARGALISELARKVVVMEVGGTGVLLKTIEFGPGEANGTLQEIGMFAGSILVAWAPISPAITKTSQYSLVCTHRDDFGRSS